MYVCMYVIINERTGSGILIKNLLFSNFVPGIFILTVVILKIKLFFSHH